MPNIIISKGVAANLYLLSGISVGTQLSVQNITGNRVRLSTSQVGTTNDYKVIDGNQVATNKTTDTGAWALCNAGDCEISVQGV